MNNTFSTTETEPLTFESILKTMDQFRNDYPVIIDELNVAPDIFKKLNRYFEDEATEAERQGRRTIPPEQVWLSSLYGMEVVVDTTLKPGTWKFIENRWSVDDPIKYLGDNL